MTAIELSTPPPSTAPRRQTTAPPHGVGENEDNPEAIASFRDDHRGGSWRPLNVGDWVLRDDAGDWHSCRNDRFQATYKSEQ